MCAMIEKLRRCWFSAAILRRAGSSTTLPEPLAEPRDRRPQPLLQGYARLPAEQRPRPRDVRPTLLRVVLGQRTYRADLSAAPRHPAYHFRQLDERELVRVPQVDGQAVASLPQREEPVDEVVHVTEASRLLAVAMHGEVLAADG